MFENHEEWPAPLRGVYHWAAIQGKHLSYGVPAMADLSFREWNRGLATGKAASLDALSFGLAGRLADAMGSGHYERYRRELGYETARKLGVVSRDALLCAGLEGFVGMLPWQTGTLGAGVMGETSTAGSITIAAGLEGSALRQTLRHEQLHSLFARAIPGQYREAAAIMYQRGGLWTWLEEFSANVYATGRPLASAIGPFADRYIKPLPLATDLLLLWASMMPATPSATPGHARKRLDAAHGNSQWPVPTVPSSGPARRPSSRTGTMSAPSLMTAASASTWPTWSFDAPRPMPMDSVRSLFASRLTDAGRGLFGTRFGIDGVAVDLSEGSATARVEDDSVLLPDAPEMRGGHLSLTRAAALVVEHRVDQTLREWSVHRRFGARLSAAHGIGDEARLTIDGVEVVLRHGQSRATVAGDGVTLSPPPRRALGAMTLAPVAHYQLDQAISAAQRAAATQPAAPAAPWTLWSPETAAPNSVFVPRTLKPTGFVFDRLF